MKTANKFLKQAHLDVLLAFVQMVDHMWLGFITVAKEVYPV